MSSTAVPRSSRFEAWRLFAVYGVVFLVLSILLGRLIILQVLEGTGWKAQGVENYTKSISVPAQRGIIYDRNGFVLARNIAAYNIVITPAQLPDDDADIQRIYRIVSEITGVAVGGPVTDETLAAAKLFSACVEGPGISDLVALGDSLAPYSPVRVKCNVSEDVARLVRERSVDLPGVSVEIEPIRDYPTGSLTANVVGFLGPIPAAEEEALRARRFVPNRDKIGYAGVEASLQEILAGKNGLRVIQVDVAGKELRNLEAPIAASSGSNITLTIDTRLQAVAEASLLEEINFQNTWFAKVRISSGVVIAMNPKTGEILAMVSYPTYENNRMARIIPSYYYEQLREDPRHPLLNNAVSAVFPPGSVFKLSTATGAFNEGVVNLNTVIFAPGKLEVCEKFTANDTCSGNLRQFVDWIFDTRPEGFGQIDFLHCIAYSSNVCFYKLGGGFEDEIPEGLGIIRLGEYARALGYDHTSGIELQGEAKGRIPSPDWKRISTGENWSTGDTYISSVGQGYVTATPLQVIMSGATIANNGKLMQPTIVRQVTDEEGNVQEVWFNPDPQGFSVWFAQTTPDSQGNPRKVYTNPANPILILNAPPAGSYQISPFVPNLKWDITQTALIQGYSCDQGFCDVTNEMKVVNPATVDAVRAGTRLAVTDPSGTLNKIFMVSYPLPISVAGKTGTAEYCDDVARKAERCQFGSWPTHAWTLAYAPYEDPEIIVLAFAYNGGEGSSVAGPIVARVLQAYFELKAIDIAQGLPAAP